MSNVVRLNTRRVNQTQVQSPYDQMLALVVDFDDQTQALINNIKKDNTFAAEVFARAIANARFYLTTAAAEVYHGEE